MAIDSYIYAFYTKIILMRRFFWSIFIFFYLGSALKESIFTGYTQANRLKCGTHTNLEHAVKRKRRAAEKATRRECGMQAQLTLAEFLIVDDDDDYILCISPVFR